MTEENTVAGLVGVAGLVVVTLWSGAFAAAESPGDPERGRVVFSGKQCIRCHVPQAEKGVGPALEELRRPQGAFQLAGRLWNHAPAMFALLQKERVEWPEIAAVEMADLMAYLGADPSRDAAPDLLQGQAALVRKGCLKCHSLKGEGARIGPELSERRALYDSASVWAARMWTHSPRMAAKAAEHGLLLPRFAGEELGNLISFLRSATR
ncbi:MAG: c-type cytochrome [Candidatus Rokubacteria bacterium]|nr:c-type cytochrome [Candidatus Rokubacteria bacterium]